MRTTIRQALDEVGRMDKKAKPGLNTRHARFVAEYLIDGNAGKAYTRAGYSATPAAAAANGHRLLKNAEIAAAIEAGQQKTLAKLELTAERVLLEVARLAYFDPRRLLKPDGSPKDIGDLDDDTAACIGGLDVLEQYEGSGKDRVFTGYLKKYKIFDKNSALTNALKVLRLTTDKMEVTGPNGGPLESRSQVTIYMPANGRD
jgi:phage terminase small subunit